MSEKFDWNSFEEEPQGSSNNGEFIWENFEEDSSTNSTKNPQEDSTPSEMKSALLGGVQGVTQDFGDEIMGAIEGSPVGGAKKALNYLGTNFNDEDVKEYEKVRDEYRKMFKEAEEVNPKSYLSGNVLGGMSTGLLTGGAGVVANVGKTGLRELAKQGLKIGAAQGAASGLGYSEGETLPELAKDTVTNALLGGAIGGVTPAAVKGVGATYNYGKNLSGKAVDKLVDVLPEPVGLTRDAYRLAEKGAGKFVGRGGKDAIESDSMKLANDILSGAKAQYETGSKMVGKALSKSDKGARNMSAQLNKLNSIIDENKIVKRNS